MITITSTAESLEQAKALLEAGVDRLYIGEKNYGLRVPTKKLTRCQFFCYFQENFTLNRKRLSIIYSTKES